MAFGRMVDEDESSSDSGQLDDWHENAGVRDTHLYSWNFM